MPTEESAIRAQASLLVLQEARKLPEPQHADVFGRLATSTEARILAARPLRWLPMTVHMDLCDAVRAGVGGAANVNLWDRAASEAFRGGFLAGLFGTTIRVFGSTPRGLLKVFARTYEYTTRHLGTVRVVDVVEGEAVLELSGFPAQDHAFECYVEGLQGSIAATLSVFHRDGEVCVLERSDLRGAARYQVCWS